MSNLTLKENVKIAETLLHEEVYKNALENNTNTILKVMERDNSNKIAPANADALGSTFMVEGLGDNTFETLDYLTQDSNINQTMENEETSETVEEFHAPQKPLSKRLLERKKQTELLEQLVEAFENTDEPTNEVSNIETGEVSNRDKTKSKKTLVLDTGTGFKPLCRNLNTGSCWSKVNFTSTEPMLFGGQTDVYLESLTINNPAQANNTDNVYICIDFNFEEGSSLGNNTFSNKKTIQYSGINSERTFNHMHNRFVIPNENTSSNGTNTIMKYHLKSNYVGLCNVTKIQNISVSFTNENGDSIQVGRNIVTEPSSVFKNRQFTVTNLVALGTTTAFEISPKLFIDLGGGMSEDPSTNYLDVFTLDGTKVGRVTAYSDEDLTANPGDPTTITMAAGTLVALEAGQTLRFSRTDVNVTLIDSVEQGTTSSFELSGYPTGLVVAGNERIYNKNGVEIGIVTSSSRTAGPDFNPTITIDNGTNIDLAAGDEIFFAPGRSRYVFFGSKAIGSADEVEREIPDDGEYRGMALQKNSVYGKKADLENDGLLPGVTIYDSSGRIIGVIDSVEVRQSDPSPVEAEAGALFFTGGIQTSLIAGGEPIFTKPPRAVFADNSRTNRIIMELIFREKDENILLIQ